MKAFVTIVLGGLLSTSSAAFGWLSGVDPHDAVLGPPGQARWSAAVAAVAPDERPPDPANASPAQVRGFIGRLTPRQRQELARRAPGVMGNLDGVPAELRYQANAYTAPAAPAVHGRLLGYDPRGDGRVIEVFGDLDRARRIAVLVPGSGWDLRKVLRDGGAASAGAGGAASAGDGADPLVAARTLDAEMRRREPGTPTAVVMWLGYDTPENVDRQAARSERAAVGARALTRFLAGLPAGAQVTLVGHSYGTVVCGRAVRAGAHVTDLVALASPGMDVRSRASLRGARRVWAVRAAGDLIRLTPYVRFGGFGHGADPVDPSFGAAAFGIGAASGHAGYFAPGGEPMTNLARIALGEISEVTHGPRNTRRTDASAERPTTTSGGTGH